MHWPRLDWMIWFVPLQLARSTSHFKKMYSKQMRHYHGIPQWYINLHYKLLESNNCIVSNQLLLENPFKTNDENGGIPPKYVRTVVYKFEYETYPLYTDENGQKKWWKIEGPVVYFDPICIK